MARAWERMDRGQRFEHLAGWVATAALNQARSGRRRRASERLAVERMDAGRTGYSDHGVNAEHGVETQMLVRSAVEGLARRQREAVVLYYLLDVDVATVATLLGVSPATVKTALARARQKLAVVLREEQLEA